MTALLGIDFGTTNTSIARLLDADDDARVLRDADGQEKTPSVVYFGDDATLVGSEALSVVVEARGDPDVEARLIQSIKRNLLDPPVIGLPGGRMVTPVGVVAEIVGKLKADAEAADPSAPFTHAMLTCPAVFDALHGKALVDAAIQAGFEEVELVEEPVAAAMAFDHEGGQIGRGVLVFDWGGGTFDVAFVAREPGDERFYLALEPAGDRDCGGDDLDLRLYDFFDQQAMRELGHGLALDGHSLDAQFLRTCRRRKESLSKSRQATFSTLLGGSVPFRAGIDRAGFEALITDHVETTVRLTAEMAERARTAGYVVDTVLLIGGSSQLPLVERRVRETLEIEPQQWASRDVAVALGAAYYADTVWGGRRGGKRTPAGRYRRAVVLVWSDGRITADEARRLVALRDELKLSGSEAAAIERDVTGRTLEEIAGLATAPSEAVVANLVRRGESYRHSGRLEQALAAFDRALALDADDPPARAGRAAVNATAHHYADARADFDVALAGDPDLVAALVGRARLVSEGGSADAALADAERAVRIDPDSSDALIARGMARRAAELTTLALQDLDRAVEVDPASAEALAWRGLIRLRLGLVAEGRADFVAALELDPACIPALAGRAAADEPDGDEMLERALEIDPRHPLTLVISAGRRAGADPDGAREQLDLALEVSPENVEALLARGRLALAARHPGAAMADLDRAAELAPHAADARYARALALLELEQPDEAARELGQAADARGLTLASPADVQLMRGRLLFNSAPAEAIDALTRAIELDPASTVALAARAEALLVMGEAETAIRDATTALGLEPELTQVRVTRASALALLARHRGGSTVPGDFTASVRQSETGISCGPARVDGLEVELLVTTERLVWRPPDALGSLELRAAVRVQEIPEGMRILAPVSGPQITHFDGTDVLGLGLALDEADLSALATALISLLSATSQAIVSPVVDAWPPPRLTARWAPPTDAAGARSGHWPAPLRWPPPLVR